MNVYIPDNNSVKRNVLSFRLSVYETLTPLKNGRDWG